MISLALQGCIGVAFAILAIDLAWATGDNPKTRPHIILVMADDLGFGDVAYNGNPTLRTPHLDAWAREGVRLDRFYAASPVCSPTRGSCLTGRHPSRYGLEWAGDAPLRRQELTFAEVLRDAGYATGHFGKWHVGGLSQTLKQSEFPGAVDPANYSPPWENGFGECFSTDSMVPTYNPYYHVGGAFGADDYRFLQTVPVAHGQRTGGHRWRGSYWTGPGQIVDDWLAGDDSEIIVDRAIDFLRRQFAANRPALALVWFHAPHTPVVASREDRLPYAEEPMPAQHWFGAITAMDRQIGRLRSFLKEQRVADNTIVWFCSDNGPSYIHDYNSAGPFRGKKATLWEGGIRVPAIVEWPARWQGGRVVTAPLSTSDFYPTLLSAAEVELPVAQPPLDGIDVAPVLVGKQQERGQAIAFQSPVKSTRDVLARPGSKQLALLDDQHKLISVDGGKSWRLFDLVSDPGEARDLAPENPERVASLRTTLLDWVESCSRSAEGADYR